MNNDKEAWIVMQPQPCSSLDVVSTLEVHSSSSSAAKLIELDLAVVEKKLSTQVCAQSLRGSSCKLECGVLNVDDSGQYDRGEVGSGDGMSGSLRSASREQDLPIGSGDV